MDMERQRVSNTRFTTSLRCFVKSLELTNALHHLLQTFGPPRSSAKDCGEQPWMLDVVLHQQSGPEALLGLILSNRGAAEVNTALYHALVVPLTHNSWEV